LLSGKRKLLVSEKMVFGTKSKVQRPGGGSQCKKFSTGGPKKREKKRIIWTKGTGVGLLGLALGGVC